jgi:16S rRNA (cytosine967-C5)-methyltransferase
LDLVVTDKRESIIRNLKKRFEVHGIKNYQAIATDVTKPLPRSIVNAWFNLIICDAPCTGSGTWSRTPEQLYFFDTQAINRFSQLQTEILFNVIPRIQEGGFLVYITCSVFKKENEEIVEFIESTHPLKLQHKEVLKGYGKKADTMFVALFQRLS